METATLWSLRLGFSAAQAEKISTLGITQFLKKSFTASYANSAPDILEDEPKTLEDFRRLRQMARDRSPDDQKRLLQRFRRTSLGLKVWWLDQMETAEFPLRENLTCFWHNHFVSTQQKVRINYWVYQHNMKLREHALGNVRTLTKAMLKTNAMVRYLDNNQNRRDKINENLSRELLELFTLGLGNYSEKDIRNGAMALAGLTVGSEGAVYRPFLRVREPITYLGKTGRFDVDDLVDIIFEHPQSPYLITRKLLQWFVYDAPPENLVKKYGAYLKEVDFELKPFLLYLFSEEFNKPTTGSKIKDPLRFALQSRYELGLNTTNRAAVALFLKQQGMDLFNQPNVKGWEGGKSWLTSQLYLTRSQVIDLMCRGELQSRGGGRKMAMPLQKKETPTARIAWQKTGSRDEILNRLTQRWLFDLPPSLEKELKTVLPYDFNPKADYADQAILRLYNFVAKTPEYQLI